MKNLNPLQKVLYYFIYPACMYFSISIFAASIVANDPKNPSWAPTLTAMLWFWIFSLALAALGNIFRTDKINLLFKILLHYTGTITAFILIFLVAVSNYENAAGAIMISIVLSVVYFIIASIVLLIRGVIKHTENKSERYKKQFNG
jgi:hypothetical protein